MQPLETASHRLIVTVHGIRTGGDWQERFEQLVQSSLRPLNQNVTVFNYKYGFFSLLAFATPPLRWLVTRRFREELVRATGTVAWDRIDIVAHSFGTHLVAKALYALADSSAIQINTVILAGSVLKPSFHWTRLLRHNVQRVINDCGVWDAVLFLNQLVILGTGMAGFVGFKGMTSVRMRNRFFRFGHSGYFRHNGQPIDAFMQKWWIPLLHGSDAPELCDERPQSALYGTLTFIANNVAPLKVLCYWVPIALAVWLWTAAARTSRAQDLLNTANSLDSSGERFRATAYLAAASRLRPQLPDSSLLLAEHLVSDTTFSVIGVLQTPRSPELVVARDGVWELSLDTSRLRLRSTDLAAGSQLRQPISRPGKIAALKVSGDGRRVFLLMANHSGVLYDTHSTEQIAATKALVNDGSVPFFDISYDGTTVAILTKHTLRLWKPPDNPREVVSDIDTLEETGFDAQGVSLAFDASCAGIFGHGRGPGGVFVRRFADNRWLKQIDGIGIKLAFGAGCTRAAVADGKLLTILNIETGVTIADALHADDIIDVSAGPNQGLGISVSAHDARLWDLRRGAFVGLGFQTGGRILRAGFGFGDRPQIVVETPSGGTYLWAASVTGPPEVQLSFQAGAWDATRVFFANSGDVVAIDREKGKAAFDVAFPVVRRWRSENPLNANESDNPLTRHLQLYEYNDQTRLGRRALTLDDETARMMAATKEGVSRGHDVYQDEIAEQLFGVQDAGHVIGVDRHGDLAITFENGTVGLRKLGRPGRVPIEDVASNRHFVSEQLEARGDVAFSEDDAFLALRGWSEGVASVVWVDTSNGRIVGTALNTTGTIEAVSADGRLTVATPHGLEVWTPRPARLICSVNISYPHYNVALSRDSRHAVMLVPVSESSAHLQTPALIDLAACSAPRFIGSAGSATIGVFSPDSALVAVAGAQEACVWLARSAQLLFCSHQPGDVVALAFNDKSDRLAISRIDTSVWVRDIPRLAPKDVGAISRLAEALAGWSVTGTKLTQMADPERTILAWRNNSLSDLADSSAKIVRFVLRTPIQGIETFLGHQDPPLVPTFVPVGPSESNKGPSANAWRGENDLNALGRFSPFRIYVTAKRVASISDKLRLAGTDPLGRVVNFVAPVGPSETRRPTSTSADVVRVIDKVLIGSYELYLENDSEQEISIELTQRHHSTGGQTSFRSVSLKPGHHDLISLQVSPFVTAPEQPLTLVVAPGVTVTPRAFPKLAAFLAFETRVDDGTPDNSFAGFKPLTPLVDGRAVSRYTVFPVGKTEVVFRAQHDRTKMVGMHSQIVEIVMETAVR